MESRTVKSEINNDDDATVFFSTLLLIFILFGPEHVARDETHSRGRAHTLFA